MAVSAENLNSRRHRPLVPDVPNVSKIFMFFVSAMSFFRGTVSAT